MTSKGQSLVEPFKDESYAVAIESFDLYEARRSVFSLDLAAVNAAEICCDRHASDLHHVALRHRSADGRVRDWTFAELQSCSAKFAEVLASNGVAKGDRVAGLLPRTPELLITILATWRLGGVYQPLFTAFGSKAIEHRIVEAQTKLVVTDAANRAKVAGLSAAVRIVTVEADPEEIASDFWRALNDRAGSMTPTPCTIDDPFLIMFTSGTTGPAKALQVPLGAIAAFVGYMKDAVGLRPNDHFWNIADPGWAYGLYYAVTGPLAMGIATTFFDGPFSVESTYDTIEQLGITNLAGSPTAYRMLIAAGFDAASRVKGRLRAVSSAGEPLNPEVIRWFADHLDVPIHDHYGQTELGMVLGNHHALAHPIRPGSTGYAIPGHSVVVCSPEGDELGPGEPGILALDRSQSPLMWFSGYLGRDTSAFVGRFYLSGDTVEMNDDGSIAFVGRTDDVITTSGYRVGPFEVESALIEFDFIEKDYFF